MREYRLVEKAIHTFGLDLTDRHVLTEAASNAFIWTPLVAALAGAKVTAITDSSHHSSVDQVVKKTQHLARTLGVANRIDIRVKRTPDIGTGADIITNLGFVRPINENIIRNMNSGGVICLMWEPWEFRKEDIDVDACRRHGIAVLGTNEHDPRLNTYAYVGLMVLKLLLEQNIELLGSTVLLLGHGPFTTHTARQLRLMGTIVYESPDECPRDVDCVVCLEHQAHDFCLVGKNGLLDLSRLAGHTPLIIHICGNIDAAHITEHGCRCVPSVPAPCGHMSFTTAHVGPKPVINLHTAGLRIGQAWLEHDATILEELALPLPHYNCIPAMTAD